MGSFSLPPSCRHRLSRLFFLHGTPTSPPPSFSPNPSQFPPRPCWLLPLSSPNPPLFPPSFSATLPLSPPFPSPKLWQLLPRPCPASIGSCRMPESDRGRLPAR